MKKELDYLGIFEALNSRGIRYLVCGGVAVNLWGIPRMTYDIDLLIDMNPENLKRFIDLLRTWGFKPKLPVEMSEFFSEKKRREWVQKKNMKAFSFRNPDWAISEIDVVIDSPVSFRDAVKRALSKSVDRVEIPLLALQDLIEMKRTSGRKQDLSDVEYLQKLWK